MLRLATRAGALWLGGAVMVFTPLAAAQSTSPDFKRMILKYGKQSVQATVGQYCIPTADGKGQCETATYPLKTTGRITVRQHGRVTLLLGAPAGYITWRAARITGSKKNPESITATGEATVVGRSKKRWTVQLPKNLRTSSDLLGFNVVYPSGFSAFEVGVKVLKAKKSSSSH
jgi:hypothetical protein